MFEILLSLLFRINLPNNGKSALSTISKIKDLGNCRDYDNEKFYNLKYNNFLLKCSNIEKNQVIFNNTRFSDLYSTSENSKYMAFVTNNNFFIENCNFNKCYFSTSMIYHQSTQHNLSMHSNTIVNCYDPSNTIFSSNIIKSNSHYADIQNNLVNFIDIKHSCRAFDFEKSTNTILKHNIVKNANTGTFSGSGVNFHTAGSGIPLQITDCSFINCLGYKGSTFSMSQLNYSFTILRTSFENCKNSKKFGSFFLINYQDDFKQATISFNECEFNFFESNSIKSGAFGLTVEGEKLAITMIFKNTIFQHFYYAGENSGALVFSKSNFCDLKQLTIDGCTFNNITSFNGDSIVLTNCFKCMIEKCNFIDCCTTGFAISSTANDLCVYDSIVRFSHNDKSQFSGGISVQSSGKTEIENVQFINTVNKPALLINQQSKTHDDLVIFNCIFDSCSGAKCFEIISKTTSLTFQNNVMKNSFIEEGNNNFLGTINCNSKINALDIINMTCTNNVFGAGILFKGIPILSFNKCTFVNNKGQEKISLREETTQFNSMDVEFIDCTFKQNHAFKNGGAVSIQTHKEVEFKRCLFDHNTASPRGKGGAIFINRFSSSNNEITHVTIEDCKFLSNQAFDGFAIYIKGDDKNTEFTIKNNLFVDNYVQKSDLSTKSVIKSEILNIYNGRVLNENKFIYTEKELNVNSLLYSDPKEKNQAELLESSFNKIHTLSNSEFTGELPAIYVNDSFPSDEVSNSRFIDCKIPEGENYLFVVQKKYLFENIEFSFENSQIGAIKIVSSDSVTIRNCKFNGCSSKDGFSSAITIIGTESNKKIKENVRQVVIEDLEFTKCGVNGFAFTATNHSHVIIRNIVVEFESQENSGGGMLIQNCGICTVSDSTINNTNSQGIKYVLEKEPAVDDMLLIDNATFDRCNGVGCYLDVQPSFSIKISIESCNFEDCKKGENQNSIAIGINKASDSILLNIRDNTFTNCGEKQGSNYVIIFEMNRAPKDNLDAIVFENNIIEFEDASKSCIALRAIQENREIKIHNCSFSKCSQSSNYEQTWENCLSLNKFNKVEISECQFSECGSSGGGNVIVIQSGVGECTISGCRIKFSNPSSSGSGISTYTDNILIENNEFIKCNENTIRVECKTEGSNEFRLINNLFIGSEEGAALQIAGNRLTEIPTIKDNRFENIKVLQGIEQMIIIDISKTINNIEIVNNTFNQIQTQIENFGININREKDETNENQEILQIKYIECNFSNNKQIKRRESKYENTKITYDRCLFESNEGEGYGGSLYIKNYQTVTIETCEFNLNFVTEIVVGTGNKQLGQGGSIFIESGRVIISGSKFNNNYGGYGQAIYLLNNDCQLKIDSNSEFNNNINLKNMIDKQYAIHSNSEHIDISTTSFKLEINEQPEGSYSYQCGFIYLTNSGNININECNFSNSNFRSSILYKIKEKSSSENKFSIYGCEFRNCLTDVLSIELPSASNESIRINECNFNECKGRNKGPSTTIHIREETDSIKLNIENNRFTNCGELATDNYVLKMSMNRCPYDNLEAIAIENNIIEFEDASKSCIALRVVQENREIKIHNCSFSKCSQSSNSEQTWENCLSLNKFNKVEISESQFSECGICSQNNGCPSPSGGGNVIVIQEGVTESTISGCRIEFENADIGGSGISTYSNNNIIENNEFIKCYENAIRVEYKKEGSTEFVLINNLFSGSVQGAMISFFGDRFMTKSPTIKDNRFDSVSVLQYDEVMIHLKVGKTIEVIEFENNTFHDVHTQIENFGISIDAETRESTQGILEEKHIKSKFSNNHQRRLEETQKENIKYSIEQCIFENNECESKGGSLFIKSNHEINIQDCEFISCTAAEGGTAIYVESASKTTINNCEFTDCKSTSTDSQYTIKIVSGTAYFDTCVISFDDNSNAFGGIDLGNQEFNLQNCMFIKTRSSGSILFEQSETNSAVSSIVNCTFEECAGETSRCFSLSFSQSSDLTFKDVVVRKMVESGPNGYFGSISFKNKANFDINNLTFTENKCNSLYGGGSGLLISGTEKISFVECQFIDNTALQTTESERPKPSSGNSYFNGDGGGLQIGYSPLYYNVDLSFERCLFKGNKAFRHGGGVALQTSRTITITYCDFDSNSANNQETTKSSLLFDTYYHQKTEGRGGAIYINPTFSNEQQNEQQKDDKLSKIDINNCNFTSNSAFDGFAIYIEGDGDGVEFVFTSNKFVDNSKKGTTEDAYEIYRAVITSEVFNLYDGKIVAENDFKATDGSKPNELLYVDHDGNPIIESSSIESSSEEIVETSSIESTNEEVSSSSEEVVESTSTTDDKEVSSSDNIEESSSSSSEIESESESESLPSEEPVDNCHGNNRCDLSNQTHTSFNITSSGFINLTHTDDGAAIHFINCALHCNETYFYNCSSTNGGGGGIYIYLDTIVEKEVLVDSCTFVKCRSHRGGAIYAYSDVEENNIVVQNSQFNENEIIPPLSTADIKLYGGSAIFMMAKNCIVLKCNFLKNRGKGGALKMIGDFESSAKSNLIKLDSNPNVLIENCKFEIDSTSSPTIQSSSSSISYVRGKKEAVLIGVRNCDFSGDLSNKDAHHIEVSSAIKEMESPKLRISSCRFSSDKKHALKLDDQSSSLVSFDVNKQEFVVNEIIHYVNLKLSNEKVPSKLFILSIFMAAVLIAIVIINKTKKFIDNLDSKIENDLVDKNEIINQNIKSLI